MRSGIKSCLFAGCALSLIILSSCGGGSSMDMNMNMTSTAGSTSGSTTASTMLAPNFDSIQADVFTPICSGCHGGADPASDLSLAATQSYDDLINVPSTEQPSIVRVKPLDPTNSYLIIHMQREGDGAPAADIPVIAQWITEGAMPGMSGMGGMGMGMSTAFEVRATLPANGDSLQSSPPRVIVGFTQELDASSLNAVSVRLERLDDTPDRASPTNVVPAVMSVPPGNARALILTPSSALAPGRYQVVLDSMGGADLRSQYGSPLGAPAPDATGLRVMTRFSVAPPDGTTLSAAPP